VRENVSERNRKKTNEKKKKRKRESKQDFSKRYRKGEAAEGVALPHPEIPNERINNALALKAGDRSVDPHILQ
jgi:hypothetical protein